jgi:NAD-dependent dihydropyrimidine dehydrogenase PreA subunit
MTLALLQKFCPFYYLDHREDIMPISYSDFALQNKVTESNSVTGVVQEGFDNTRYLYYFMTFETDGGLRCCCWKKLGAHYFDLEHVVVHVDENEQMIKMLFCPHGKKEWYWIRNPECIGCRPCVYVSYHKHASRHRKGIVFRYGGILRDECIYPRKVDCIVTIPSEEVMRVVHVNNDTARGIPLSILDPIESIPIK